MNLPAVRRRQFLAASLVSLLPLGTRAQTFPSRPITVVVPFPPGGSVDLIARLFAEPLAKALGVPVVIENRAGVGGSLGSAAVARAQPDGYTLVVASQSSHLGNPLTNPKVGYDPIRDFTLISEMAQVPNVLVVNPALPVKTFKEFMAYVQARPGALNYCSAGPGSMGQLNVELLKSAMPFDAVHISYRGGGPLLTAILSNEVQFALDNLGPFLPHVQSGKLRALAVAAPTRSPQLPDVPTFAELGLPTLNAASWAGLAAPAKTPAAVANAIAKAVRTVATQPDMVEQFASRGLMAPQAVDTASFTAMLTERLATYGELVKRYGIRSE